MSLIDDKRVYEYLENVCRLIKNKSVHEDIKDELLCHIEDRVEIEISSGKSIDEAIEIAICNMGDFKTVGKELGKIHKSTPDWLLLIITAMLITLGMVSLAMPDNNYNNLSKNFFVRSLSYGILGLVVLIVLQKFDYKSLKKHSVNIYIGTWAILILTVLFSTYISKFIILHKIAFSFINISPFVFVIALCGVFDNYNWNNKECLKCLIMSLMPALFFILIPSLPNAMIYSISIMTVVIVAGMKKIYISLLGGFSVILFYLMVWSQPYRISRIFTFLNYEQDVNGQGYIYNIIAKLLKSSKFIGQGNISVLQALPNAKIDFVLIYILSTFGWIAAISLIILVLAFIMRIGIVYFKIKNKYGKLLIIGLFMLFLVQFSISILMNLCLFPILGVNMPFISYGVSNLFISIISIGIISSIYKWENVKVVVDE